MSQPKTDSMQVDVLRKPPDGLCRSCKWWRVDESIGKRNGKTIGRCHRRSPGSGYGFVDDNWGGSVTQVARWPDVVAADDFCGEYENGAPPQLEKQ